MQDDAGSGIIAVTGKEFSVTFDKTIYNRLPLRFEAGTPNIAGVILA